MRVLSNGKTNCEKSECEKKERKEMPRAIEQKWKAFHSPKGKRTDGRKSERRLEKDHSYVITSVRLQVVHLSEEKVMNFNRPAT